ncbi:hypothetical protein [Acidicapsa ligni]|uniref:hypothetical protein n=1 Tax=Acidicapsa ligni TaxID=542300 RepID=UPI0021E0C66D|nr:hypothetical protein [Acidicapsa ligni]
MQRSEPENNLCKRLARTTCMLSGVLMAFWIAGCGGSSKSSSTPPPAQQAPQSYFAPGVSGFAGLSGPQTFIFDDIASPMTFSQETFALNLPSQTGLQVSNAGRFTIDPRGLRSLAIWTTYVVNPQTNAYLPMNYTTPETGGFAVELANQAGGFIQMVGQPAMPLIAATQCPGSTSVTYQFITLPEATYFWNPTTDTAYGSVDIASNGSAVNFQNIHQYTMPPPSSGGAGGTPVQPSSTSPVTGACGPTTLGAITGVPGMYVDPDPGISNSVPPQAAVGIGPTGLLAEDNGAVNGSGETFLGAGTGALGLPKPTSPLSANGPSALVGAQYLGFIYSAGQNNSFGSLVLPSSSHLASFGFSSVPSSCASIAPSTPTMIYGGDFPQSNGQDNPSASPDGFGNCDFAIDLGKEDPSNNGLFPSVKVTIGASYASNIVGSTYSFSAVAIAGQLNGKNAIFVLGVDSTQPWTMYLLQSNTP